jgi:hypothetical protein
MGGTNAAFNGFQLVKNDPALIQTFGLPGNPAVVGPLVANAAAISLTVPFGTDVSTLAPSFTLSSGVCNRDKGGPTTYDFTSPVDYVVTDTATDPDTVNTYTVTVTVTVPATNDDFADAIDLTGGGSGQTGTVASGTQTGTNNIGTTLEVDEPSGSGGANTVWFKWTSPADGNLTVNTAGSLTSPPSTSAVRQAAESP